MSVYESYKKRMKIDTVSTGKNYPTLGEKLKSDSDLIMEETFWNDPQSKICYIYDYFHDNEPDKNVGMTYENTTKTRIDAKFIVKSYQSLDKDQVEYYCNFVLAKKLSLMRVMSFIILKQIIEIATEYKIFQSA